MSNNIVIVVEDGTQIVNANSYVSIADMVSYALNRGVVLTADDATAAMLIQATDYLEAQALLYQGYPSTDTQALQWPRQQVFFTNSAAAAVAGMSMQVGWYGTLITDLIPFPSVTVIADPNEVPPIVGISAIPNQLITAQKMLVMAINQGINLMPNIQPSDYVISEAVGPIKTTYADPSKVGILPMFSGVDLVLQPLYQVSKDNQFGLQTVRA
jgi:hypothetical protein